MPNLPNQPGDFSRGDNARRAALRDSAGWEVYEASSAAIPATPEHWTELALTIWHGYQSDPVSARWTSQDWGMGFLLCESISRADEGKTLHRGTTLASIIDAMAKLGAGPTERRRARMMLVEVRQSDAQAAILAALADDEDDE